MNKIMLAAAAMFAAIGAVEARTPNYDESKVAPYALEDPLAFADGRKLSGPEEWPARRVEILGIFAKEMYGMEPPAPEAVVTELVEEGPTFAGLGIRRQYRMWFKADKSGPFIDWLLVLPNRPHGDNPAKKDGKVVCESAGKVPVVLMLNYRGNQTVLDEGEVKLPDGEWRKPSSQASPKESENGAMRGTGARSVILADVITARGYALLTACYAQVSPDVEVTRGNPEELAYTRIFELWPKRDESRDDNTTALGAWAWALSRGLDLAGRIPEIDARRNVVTGSSRLAKAALLAAARDDRFAVCVANQTGGGGCPLAKRDFGENVSTEMKSFPHWYCKAYAKYVDNEQAMKFDQHMLIAAVAPRALLIEGFNSGWFDTKGEYLAARAASPVWEFLGRKGLPKGEFPENYDTSLIGESLGYVRRGGQHGISAIDWIWTLNFADRALAAGGDKLQQLFDAPPQSRGANAWWHWQGANVTKSGITRDLEAMKDAGLSGATIFNIQDVGWDCEERMTTPLCPGMEYMNDKWWDLVSFAVSEAKRLGLELGIHNCPGYSTSGGPWITPELGMKKLVWAKGDAQPETKLGFYRDIARVKTKDGVYRFGYTCTGKNTHPSPPEVEAGSLEADKMNAKAVGVHIDNLLNGLAAHGIAASNPGLAFILMDSYEAGDASWTDDFAQEFAKRRGYDPVPFLPVIANLGTDFGPEREEQFRRDFTRTKNELQTERHYQLFKERLNAAGFEFHLEPYSGPFDSLEATQFCDVPMTEFWVGTPFWAKEPSKGGACWFAGPVARALGRNVTGAESFTGYPIDDPFAITPRDLKIPLDATLARGVNRLSLHHWEHQPLGANARPGYSMGPWGTHFGENQTWHEPAKGFYRYIQRCQALLQEGEMRCDALGLASFDEDGTDALPLSNFLTNTEVTASGKLRVKSSGREYSLLFLERGAGKRFAGNTSWDGVEKKCFDLVRDYEKKGLKVAPAWKRTKFFEIVEGDREGVMVSCRKAGDTAFFFVANTTDKPKKFTANFRQIEGRDFQPEIWNPETGEKRCIGDWLTKDGVTPVQLSLAAEESVFVVFRKDDGTTRFFRRILPLVETEHEVKGPWTLCFDAGGGAPQGVQTLSALKSWTDFAESGIRYYSGTATYETTLDVQETCDAIDLGDVRDVAEVFLDGERIGALWHAPYRIELPRKLKSGRHALKVRVTNAWTNRLIGDEKEPDDCVLSKKMLGFGVQMVQSEGVKRDIPHGRAVLAIPEEVRTNKPRKVARYAFSSWRYILSDKDLRPAGLLGQVKLITKKVANPLP